MISGPYNLFIYLLGWVVEVPGLWSYNQLFIPRFRFSIKPCKDYPDVGSLFRMARMAGNKRAMLPAPVAAVGGGTSHWLKKGSVTGFS